MQFICQGRISHLKNEQPYTYVLQITLQDSRVLEYRVTFTCIHFVFIHPSNTLDRSCSHGWWQCTHHGCQGSSKRSASQSTRRCDQVWKRSRPTGQGNAAAGCRDQMFNQLTVSSDAIQPILVEQGGNTWIYAVPVKCYTRAHTQLLVKGHGRGELLLAS